MRYISLYELRSRSTKILQELAQEQNLVIQSKGRPIAILSSTTVDALDESLKALQYTRATRTLMRTQMKSVRKQKDKLTLNDINRLVASVRKKRQK